MWDSWSSWSSPVGLGIFLLTAGIGFAVVIYTLLSLAGAIVSVSRSSAPQQTMSAQEMQQLEQQYSAAGTGAAQQ